MIAHQHSYHTTYLVTLTLPDFQGRYMVLQQWGCACGHGYGLTYLTSQQAPPTTLQQLQRQQRLTQESEGLDASEWATGKATRLHLRATVVRGARRARHCENFTLRTDHHRSASP